MTTLDQTQVDVVLSSRHQAVYDDDSLVGFVVDPNQYSLPRHTVHVDTEVLCECIRYDCLFLTLHEDVIDVIFIVLGIVIVGYKAKGGKGQLRFAIDAC